MERRKKGEKEKIQCQNKGLEDQIIGMRFKGSKDGRKKRRM